MSIRKLLGAVIASALVFAIPVTALADTYAPPPGQDFNGDTGGWTSLPPTYAGLCVPSLVCAAMANSWNAGGADGNGYIRTQISTTSTTLAGTSIGAWESPAFVYRGNAGKNPETATLDLNVLSNISALLGASVFNTTSFRVDLVDQSTGTGVNAVPSTPLVTDYTWTAIPSASVNPKLLRLGHTYKIRISTTYNSVAAAVATGEVGFDNVRLTTAGKGSNGGSGITTRKELRKLTKTYILPGSAKVSGGLLKMKLRCPAKAAPKPCKIQVQGLQAGKFSKGATARKIVTIKAGKSRFVKIKIKGKYLAFYKSASKVWVKSSVRVGSLRVTVRKRIKIIH